MIGLALVLRLNAASCLGFGALFMAIPSEVSSTLGHVSPAVLFGIGGALLVNGAHLLFASTRTRPLPAEILWFSMGDMAWWLATLTLIATGVWITTPLGIWLAFLVALCVAALGLGQLLYLGRDGSGLRGRAHFRRIGHSWLALPRWVKVWLFALNAVFLLSPAFLPWEAARFVLIAYVASGPLLGAFALFEGGLTRAMGLAHLVTWVPMLVWLTIWIGSSGAHGLSFGYAVLLATMTTVCLAFDVHDLWRWIRGEREILSASTTATPRVGIKGTTPCVESRHGPQNPGGDTAAQSRTGSASMPSSGA